MWYLKNRGVLNYILYFKLYKMKKEDLELIKKQTNIYDELEIEKIFLKNNSNIIKTIMELSNLKIDKNRDKPITLFDDLREICDEKDKIFQNKKSN